ncbi:MAG: ASKHA domain-containing protein [bacterium]|nr:ASKHA domain-containing protein [bacterium]
MRPGTKNRSGMAAATAAITVENIGTYTVATGVNLREALRMQGLYIDGSCGDKGTCGRCIVRILSGDAGHPSLSEAGMLGADPVARDRRLACRVTVTGDLSVAVDPERILEVDRTGRWKEIQDSPLFDPARLDLDGDGYGVAMDLGTTSIAAALYELATGRLVDIRTAANPQLPWGDEIITRLEGAARDRDTAALLRDLLWETVRGMVSSLARRGSISSGRISRFVAVANSAVHHLALGLDVEPLLTPPFAPAVNGAVSFPAHTSPFELPCGKDAVVHFAPLIGGYAGSDALVSLLAARSTGVQTGAVIDVGTNTEIAVWGKGKVMVATAPSGPAFEGGHIRSGMRAVEGAVWRVDLLEDSVRYHVIGDVEPLGICGTGIIDAVAGMVSRKVVDRSGLVKKGSHPSLSEKGLLLNGPNGVFLEPVDVATIQKAKSAIAATLQVVLNSMGLKPSELENVYLAGAFGSRLNVENAVRIGLLPELPSDRFENDRYVLAGNAALVGASMALLSSESMEAARELARGITHLNVADDPEFQELFIENLYFPERELH